MKKEPIKYDPKVMIEQILLNLQLGEDGIYSYDFFNSDQNEEKKLRESIASTHYENYLETLSYHHSVQVMDKEIDLFIKNIPTNGIILDVGGCWGWHWRHIKKTRPDITVLILDFIRENLIHAKAILGNYINNNIFLVHGDGTSLKFEENTFDGWWSVQALQHIPNFKKAVSEAWRVLKPGGIFANYSFNDPALTKLIYLMMGKHYHIRGNIPEQFYLERASKQQLEQIEEIFKNKCKKRYSEIFFTPDLKIKFPGKENSIVGKIDSYLSMNLPLFSWIANQQSFHTSKRSS